MISLPPRDSVRSSGSQEDTSSEWTKGRVLLLLTLSHPEGSVLYRANVAKVAVEYQPSRDTAIWTTVQIQLG